MFVQCMMPLCVHLYLFLTAGALGREELLPVPFGSRRLSILPAGGYKGYPFMTLSAPYCQFSYVVDRIVNVE